MLCSSQASMGKAIEFPSWRGCVIMLADTKHWSVPTLPEQTEGRYLKCLSAMLLAPSVRGRGKAQPYPSPAPNTFLTAQPHPSYSPAPALQACFISRPCFSFFWAQQCKVKATEVKSHRNMVLIERGGNRYHFLLKVQKTAIIIALYTVSSFRISEAAPELSGV